MHGTIEGDEALVANEYEEWEEDRTAQRRRRLEHGVIAALVVVVLAAVALLGFQSGAHDKDDDEAAGGHHAGGHEAGEHATETTMAPATTASAPATSAPAPTTTAPAPAAPAPQDRSASTSSDSGSAVIEDGRHPVNLTAIDTSAGTIQFDLVQWLTDDAAGEYLEAHPDAFPGLYEEYEQSGSFPYDELVVNDNPRLRTLPYASGTNALILFADDGSYTFDRRTIPVADLPGYLANHNMGLGSGEGVFWLTVEDGRITALEQQFQA